MKPLIRVIALAVVAAFLATAAAPAVVRAQWKMTTFYLCLLVDGSNRNNPKGDVAEIQAAHFAHLKALMANGKGVIAGPIAGSEGRLRGILVLRAASLEEARAVALADPAAKAGLFNIEILPWYAADEIMKPVFNPADLTTYYFGFLKKGAAWTPEQTAATKQLQAEHMAHLEASGKTGKLVIAGPISDGGDIRGILVYKTASIGEAKAIAAADPAVKAGRLKVEMHTWLVSKGALP
jgi:uncharacterized protein YciI